MYTVKQLSELASITVRTLHYYDEIGLLHPTQVGENGYRYYDDASLLRLQQILFYREIGLELLQIKDLLDSPDFDLVTALQSHRAVLQDKINRLHNLVSTVDTTIEHLTEGIDMSKKQLFKAFSEKQQKEYEREARLQYGAEIVNDSIRRWNSYGKARQNEIMQEGSVIYTQIIAALEAGKSPLDAAVQTLIARWHEHIRYFYEPTFDILRGLGEHYVSDPAFAANFAKMHPELAEYMREGIRQYVDDLETAELERMLAADAKLASK